MDISMFFEFPGLLITIGAVLLLLSIVLLIIALKTTDEPADLQEEESKVEPVVEEVKTEENTQNNESIQDQLAQSNEKIENTGILEVAQNISNKKEQAVESKENKEEPVEDDSFDLTKVFETSDDKKPDVDIPFNNEFKTPSVETKEEAEDSDDDVELL